MRSEERVGYQRVLKIAAGHDFASIIEWQTRAQEG
jgi:hypothetical protein